MKLLKTRCSRQHSGFCTVLISGTLVTASLFFNSCKKERALSTTVSSEKPKVSTMMDVSGLTDDQTDAIITQFYNDVKKLQNPTATSSVNIGLTDVVFRTEGVYNKYVVQHQDSGSMYLDTFSVNLTANRDGSVNIKEAANAFWQIKDQLMQRVQAIGDPAYTLEALDVEALTARNGSPQLVNGQYVLTIGVVLGNGGTPVPVQSPWFTTAVDHVFAAGSSYNAPPPFQGITKGQGTIIYNLIIQGAPAVYNINNQAMGAGESLRERGMPYYRSMYESASGYGYWANITRVDIPSATSSAVTNCDYVTRNIPGYTNVTMWWTQGPDNDSNSPYHDYRSWLNTAMMNFYLNYIPQYLHGIIPSGKKLYDFQIGVEGTGNNGFHSNFNRYIVFCGNYVRINTTPGPKFSIEEL
jgi:hypothetical protein